VIADSDPVDGKWEPFGGIQMNDMSGFRARETVAVATKTTRGKCCYFTGRAER
jgi:hypothetical protein